VIEVVADTNRIVLDVDVGPVNGAIVDDVPAAWPDVDAPGSDASSSANAAGASNAAGPADASGANNASHGRSHRGDALSYAKDGQCLLTKLEVIEP
jgi:hypothetical protein